MPIWHWQRQPQTTMHTEAVRRRRTVRKYLDDTFDLCGARDATQTGKHKHQRCPSWIAHSSLSWLLKIFVLGPVVLWVYEDELQYDTGVSQHQQKDDYQRWGDCFFFDAESKLRGFYTYFITQKSGADIFDSGGPPESKMCLCSSSGSLLPLL